MFLLAPGSYAGNLDDVEGAVTLSDFAAGVVVLLLVMWAISFVRERWFPHIEETLLGLYLVGSIAATVVLILLKL